MRKAGKWLAIWAWWTLVATLFTVEVVARGGSVYPITNGQILIRNLISAYIWFGLTPAVIYLTRRFSVLLYPKIAIPAQLVSSGAVSILHVALYTFILQLFDLVVLQANYLTRFQNLLAFNFNSNVVFYFLVFAATLSIDGYRRRKQADKEVEIQTETTQAAENVEPRSVQHVGSQRENLARIPIKTNGRITFVETVSIDWIEADDNYVRLYVGDRSHLVREKLSRLETQLDSNRFIRIHRSAIINADRIKELHPMPGNVFEVLLQDGKVIRSGPKYRERFASLLRE